MFFQAVPDPNEERMRQMEERITRAIETGFSKVKLQTSQTQTTSGVKTNSGYSTSRSDFDVSKMNIFDPADYLKGMKGVANEATSILTDPLKTMNQGLFDIQTNTKGIFEQFGRGREMSSGIARSFMDAKFSIMEMGGGANKVFEILEEAMRATNRTSLSGKENIDDLFAVSKVAGQGVGEMVGAFDKAGMSMFHVKDQMMKAMDYAASIGVNSKEVADKLVGNLEKLNLYNFQGGVQGMAKMAAHATMLRADMNKTLALADELLSPEKAIEMAAGLQRLGVSTSALIDPLKLMDMAQNDPAQLQKEIADLAKQYTYFNEETKKTEILPGAQRYLRELAPLLGMSTQELANMAIQSGTIERKLSEIRMPNIIQSEEDKMMIANLAELNDKTGEYEIKYIDKDGEERTRVVSELNKTMMDDIKESQKMLSMDPKTLALKQLSAVEETNALLESLGAKLPAEMAAKRTTYQAGEILSTAGRLTARTGFETIRKSTGLTKENLDKYDIAITDAITNFTKQVKDGSVDIQSIFDVIKSSYESFGNDIAGLKEKLKTEEGREQITTELSDIFKQGGKNVIDNAGDALKKAAEDEMKGAGSQFAKMLLQGVIEITGGKKETEEITSPNTQSNITSQPTINEVNNNVDGESDDGEINIVNNTINIKSKPQDSVIVDESTQKTFLGTDLLGQKDNLTTGLTGLDKTIIDYFNREGSSTDILLDQLAASKETNLLIKSMGDKSLTPTSSANVTLNPELALNFATDLKTTFYEQYAELQKNSNITTEVKVEMSEEDKKKIQEEKTEISNPIKTEVVLNPNETELNKSVETIEKDKVKIDVSYDTKTDSVVNNIKTIDDLKDHLIEFSKEITFFDEKTKTIKFLPEAEEKLKEFSSFLKVPLDELAKVSLISATIEENMGKIKFPSFEINEEQKQMLAAFAEMDEKGEYVIDFKTENGEIVKKEIDELTPKDLKEYTDQLHEKIKTESVEIEKMIQSSFENVQPKIDVKLDQTEVKSESDLLLEQVDKFFTETSLKPKFEIPDQEQQKLDKLKFQIDNLKDNLQLNPNVDVDQMEDLFLSLKDKYSNLSTKVEFEVDPVKLEEEEKKIKEEEFQKTIKFTPPTTEEMMGGFKDEYSKELEDLEKQSQLKLESDIKFNVPKPEEMMGDFKDEYYGELEELDKQSQLELKLESDVKFNTQKPEETVSQMGNQYNEELDKLQLEKTIKFTPPNVEETLSDFSENYETELKSLEKLNQETVLNPKIEISEQNTQNKFEDLLSGLGEFTNQFLESNNGKVEEKFLKDLDKLYTKKISFDTVLDENSLTKIEESIEKFKEKYSKNISNVELKTDQNSVLETEKTIEKITETSEKDVEMIPKYDKVETSFKETMSKETQVPVDFIPKIDELETFTEDYQNKDLNVTMNPNFSELKEKPKMVFSEAKFDDNLRNKEIQTFINDQKDYNPKPFDELYFEGFNMNLEKITSSLENAGQQMEIGQPTKAIPTLIQDQGFETNTMLSNINTNVKTEVGGEVKIVHELNINGKNVDKAMIEQSMSEYLKNPVFVNSINNSIKNVSSGMGMGEQMNPFQRA